VLCLVAAQHFVLGLTAAWASPVKRRHACGSRCAARIVRLRLSAVQQCPWLVHRWQLCITGTLLAIVIVYALALSEQTES
jgi:hypothetical protein